MLQFIKTLRFFLLSFILSLCIALPMLAQTPTQTTTKFDEFGDEEYSSLIARLDNFAIELQNSPTARGYIFMYRDRRDLPGLNTRRLRLVQSYMVNSRGVDPSHFVTVNGGIKECRKFELWVVPSGATPPSAKPDYTYSIHDTDATYKFDEYFYLLPSEYSDTGDTNYVHADFEAYAEALRQKPGARACIIMYAQHHIERGFNEYTDEGEGRRPYRKVISDSPATVRRVLAAEKRRLTNAHRIPASRIITIDGGYRAQRAVELWVVPRGEAIPLATPTVRPLRRKK